MCTVCDWSLKEFRSQKEVVYKIQSVYTAITAAILSTIIIVYYILVYTTLPL